MTDNPEQVRRSVRRWLWIFIVCLVLSGLTAFPLETETRWLADLVVGGPIGERFPALADRAVQVRDALAETNARHPSSPTAPTGSPSPTW